MKSHYTGVYITALSLLAIHISTDFEFLSVVYTPGGIDEAGMSLPYAKVFVLWQEVNYERLKDSSWHEAGLKKNNNSR